MSKVPNFELFLLDPETIGNSIKLKDGFKGYVKAAEGYGRISCVFGDKYFHEDNETLTWRIDFNKFQSSAFEYGVIPKSSMPLKNDNVYKKYPYAWATNGGFSTNTNIWGWCDNKSKVKSYVILKLDCEERILYCWNPERQEHFAITDIKLPVYPFFHSWCSIDVDIETGVDYPEIGEEENIIFTQN
eukprot:TRINITY_DN667_c0_g1_i1.p1 TRINITY_DN667_c0_g1~~TRINITY_DN667_c0_g1_i1.p1  ORF type:complete len:187 (-),score=55.31 TRINITY_DN667_c0_g1_i1:722-1282(-)